MDFFADIKGFALEFYEDEHIYLVNGEIVPSITQIVGSKFGGKYDAVNERVLNEAAVKGVEVHEAIERYCKIGEEADLPEVRGFKFLQREYEFEVLGNEIPLILFRLEKPIAAGRCDMVIQNECGIGGADIKRTAVLDKNYLSYQLNLYRIAYRQCYGVEWSFLVGLHLRDDIRKFVGVPVNEVAAWDLIEDYFGRDIIE
jgi:hypothetical protein